MQVRNNSARLHTVGETLIVPGTTVELGEEWRAFLVSHAELEIVEESGVKPAAVVGIPVGFVGAAESKEALIANGLGLDYLVLRGRRGGSAITSAAINALSRPGI